jgi:uncharacterized UPF0146 family protein
MTVIGYDDLADFIIASYPRGSRIVEVGIGGHPEVALSLKDTFNVICTDIFEGPVPGIDYVKDDIFCPDMDIYRGASLIYSIRPPVDMQEPMAAIAKAVGADLIVRPFSSERTDLRKYMRSFRCVNHGKSVFFLYTIS